MLNETKLIGRVGKDPEINRLQSGSIVAKVTLATTEKYKDKSGEKVEKTEWHSIAAWGKLAEIIEKYVKKGDLVYFGGKLTYRSYEAQNGDKKYFTEIKADTMKMLGGANGREEQSIPTSSNAQEATPSKGDDMPF